VDEKSQVQALERTQPILPLGLGYVEGATHDYFRHGTTTLFAALNVLDGSVITQCKPRHRHQEFLAFLQHLDRNILAHLDVHLILDNYATHKHPKIKPGWPVIPAITCTSLPPMPAGLIRSSAGSSSSPSAPSAAAPFATSAN
jgi:hypothetical protein